MGLFRRKSILWSFPFFELIRNSLLKRCLCKKALHEITLKNWTVVCSESRASSHLTAISCLSLPDPIFKCEPVLVSWPINFLWIHPGSIWREGSNTYETYMKRFITQPTPCSYVFCDQFLGCRFFSLPENMSAIIRDSMVSQYTAVWTSERGSENIGTSFQTWKK